jgi:hypothetical protein
MQARLKLGQAFEGTGLGVWVPGTPVVAPKHLMPYRRAPAVPLGSNLQKHQPDKYSLIMCANAQKLCSACSIRGMRAT